MRKRIKKLKYDEIKWIQTRYVVLHFETVQLCIHISTVLFPAHSRWAISEFLVSYDYKYTTREQFISHNMAQQLQETW